MKDTISRQSSFAILFEPAVARAVAERAAQWDIPRRMCHPLDHHSGSQVSPDVATYDAAIDLAPVTEEEPRSAASREADTFDFDFEGEDDL